MLYSLQVFVLSLLRITERTYWHKSDMFFFNKYVLIWVFVTEKQKKKEIITLHWWDVERPLQQLGRLYEEHFKYEITRIK